MDVRIIRSYRYASPGKFHALSQRLGKGLPKVWSALQGGNPKLQSAFEEMLPQYDELYHEAQLGSIVAKARRDALQAKLTELMDEIAAILETAGFYNRELLLLSGFDLAKERRGRTRPKSPAAVTSFLQSKQEGDGSGEGAPPSP
ncbi:MAG TPA: hypothetical protein VJ550_11220 [Geomonas sp.]|nr:hypothetical protein [Geomonas sp.]